MVKILEKNRLVRLDEAARRLGMSVKTARNQISGGIFPIRSVLVGRRRVVLECELEGYIEGLFEEHRGIQNGQRRGRPRREA